jgi:hypothetical protein
MYQTGCVPYAPLPFWRHEASFFAIFCYFSHIKVLKMFKNDVKWSGASTQTCMYQTGCVPYAPLPVWRHLESFCATFCYFSHEKVSEMFKNDVKSSDASTQTCMYQTRCVLDAPLPV